MLQNRVSHHSDDTIKSGNSLWELRNIYHHHHHHPESKKRKSSEANPDSIHPYGRYANAVETRKNHIYHSDSLACQGHFREESRYGGGRYFDFPCHLHWKKSVLCIAAICVAAMWCTKLATSHRSAEAVSWKSASESASESAGPKWGGCFGKCRKSAGPKKTPKHKDFTKNPMPESTLFRAFNPRNSLCSGRVFSLKCRKNTNTKIFERGRGGQKNNLCVRFLWVFFRSLKVQASSHRRISNEVALPEALSEVFFRHFFGSGLRHFCSWLPALSNYVSEAAGLLEAPKPRRNQSRRKIGQN